MGSQETGQLDPRAALDLITDTRNQGKACPPGQRRLAVCGLGVGLADWLRRCLAVGARTSPYRTPSAWTFVVMGACMAAALAISMITIGRAMRRSNRLVVHLGKLYGWAWAISFICLFFIIGGLGHAGASAAVIGLFASAGPALVVSVMYLVSGALWNNRTMFVVGAWLALTSGVAVIFGVVTFDLLIALAGGGGFLVAALYEARRKRS
jgi:uncharacterized membrane protein